MRRGVRLGVDVGTARIGLARCDPQALIATPLETLHVRGWDPQDVAEEIADIAREIEAIEVVVGLPRHLNGSEGASAARARNFAYRVARAVAPTPVRLVDERNTTLEAQRALHAVGRSTREQRVVIDQVAAVMILQNALEAERNEAPNGEVLPAPEPRNEGSAQT